MNDEIDEFIKQATKKQAFYPACNDGQPEYIVYFDKRLFAELIISKCAKIVEPTEDSGDEWCVALKGAAQEIKVHFGVEE